MILDNEKKPLNIYQRINEIRKKVDYIQKNKSVSTGGGSYKAVTHDEITGIARKHLIEFGVVVVPSLKDSNVSEVLTKDGNKSNMIRYEATYEFRVVNMDDPADFFSMDIEAHANDNQDKAPGKALSYAKKYAILKLLEIETGEDDESRHAEKPEFPIADWFAKLEAADSMDALKNVYLAATDAAKAAGDTSAVKALVGAKDRRKKALEAA